MDDFRKKKVEIPSDFDNELYLKLNPDVIEQYENYPVEHFIKYGYFENRKYKVDIPSDFISGTYLKLNPDIKQQYGDNPEIHYLKYGYFEKRPYKIDLPIDFDEHLYSTLNPDIKEQYYNNSTFHYMNYGYFENRQYRILKTIIYILCYNSEKLIQAEELYSKYSWAKPIIMKYQDYSFENAFWKQLYEIRSEWENCEMVGTLAYSAYKKINLEKVDSIISNKLYFPQNYYNFFDSNMTIPNLNTISHPHFNKIWETSIKNLNLVNTTENCCNYWMCKPELMKYFIYWYINICLPELLKNPLIFENSLYSGNDFNNCIQESNLINLWGKPFYPHLPFICERLNKSFFMKHYKIVFLISHENSATGAVNALLNVKYFYEKNNIKTILLYLSDIVREKIDIVNYIQETSLKHNCSPVVICNTFCCINIVKDLSKTNISTYWYIHEWFDPNGEYKYINDNLDLFNSSVNIIFVCKKSYENLKTYISNISNEVIIYNRLPLEIMQKKKNENPEKFIYKDENDLFLVMIGTVEKRKNHQKFIDDVFYRCKEKFPHIKLVIVGREIVTLNIKEEYKESIICIGNVENALPYAVMSDIVVSYSTNEVLPLSILESFYCSKPVVSSNAGGVCEIIENGVNGLLFNINDADTCYNYLCELIENNELRKLIGSKAYQCVIEKYDENISCEQFLLLLSKPSI
jgi:glycosyltransferase involved in cell wall biosynthesis